MTTAHANLTYYKELNEQLRQIDDTEITIENAVGQRYLGCGSSGKTLTIHGTPGNGLGQYLNGSTIEVFGNAQEAVGDTMNDGDIIIHGSAGDVCGYGSPAGNGSSPCAAGTLRHKIPPPPRRYPRHNQLFSQSFLVFYIRDTRLLSPFSAIQESRCSIRRNGFYGPRPVTLPRPSPRG